MIKNRIKPRILDFAIVRYALLIALPGSFCLFLRYLDHLESVGPDPNSYFFYFLPIFDRFANLTYIYYFFYLCLMGYFGKCVSDLTQIFEFFCG